MQIHGFGIWMVIVLISRYSFKESSPLEERKKYQTSLLAYRNIKRVYVRLCMLRLIREKRP